MAIADKLTRLAQTKASIKAALIAKGSDPGSAPFKDYPGLIEDIPTGSDHAEEIRVLTGRMSSMADLFADSLATVLDFSNFDTSNVSNMNRTFMAAKAKFLILTSFDTSNATTMNRTFQDAEAEVIDVTSFDTSNVATMDRTFANTKVEVLDLSSFDMANVESNTGMFVGSEVKTLYARTQADADKFTSSSNFPSGVTVIIK